MYPETAILETWEYVEQPCSKRVNLFSAEISPCLPDLEVWKLLSQQPGLQGEAASVLWAYERPLSPWLKSLVRSALGPQVSLRLARSFPMALGELCSRPFELLITGDTLEQGSGFQLMRCLKERKIWTPSVFLTRKGHEDLAAKCLGEGFVGYLAGDMLKDGARVSQTLSRALEEGLKRKRMISFLKQVGEMAILDPLTSLYNRFFMEKLLEMEVSRSRRYGDPFCVALLDLDGFKKVNDLLGHLRGDQLLVELAGLLKKTARATDHIGRYGGDEFLMILPRAGLASGISLCSRILEAVRSRSFWLQAGEPAVSLSIGLTHWRGAQAPGCESILDKTDRALYKAKGKGKNRICYEQA